MAKIDVWAVYGPDEERGGEHVVEVFTEEREAEAFLGGGLLQSAATAITALKPGGTFSLLLRRGSSDNPMTGGYAITNPNDLRLAKEFRVERLVAERVPQEQ